MTYPDLPLLVAIGFLVGGLAALAWSSDMFVEGAAALARKLKIAPFIIGMVIIGFGTSAPELCVSAIAGISHHSDLSLGNAYGSCIFNIAAILGIAAIICPLRINRMTAFVGGPLLTLLTAGSWWLLKDGDCSKLDALVLLGLFAILLPVYCRFGSKGESSSNLKTAPIPSGVLRPILQTLMGLVVLIGASHLLIWGAVDVAHVLGVSDLIIGLTVVAIGTSLPELASAIAAARKGEDELVLGNIVGSNLFNMLVVVGVATAISPATGYSRFILERDLPLLAAVSLSLTFFGINFRRPTQAGVINRFEAMLWVACYIGYTALMLYQEVGR